jgi:hypothetical protein
VQHKFLGGHPTRLRPTLWRRPCGASRTPSCLSPPSAYGQRIAPWRTTETAEYGYGQAQPAQWAKYLTNHGRNEEAIAFAGMPSRERTRPIAPSPQGLGARAD